MCKLRGADDRFGDYLCLDCAKSGRNQFADTKCARHITKISKPSDVSVLHDVRNRQSAAPPNVKELLFPADFSTVPIVYIKYESKVCGKLCDSRKLYFASVTIHPEGRQFHATDKICKKAQEIVYWCGH